MRFVPPPGFSWRRAGWLHLCAGDSVAEGLSAALRDGVPAALEELPGRGAVARLRLEGGGSAILRRYRRGGLAGTFLPDVFWGPRRGLRELEVAHAARRAGAPVPEPLAIACSRRFLPGRLYMVTREVEDAVPLRAALAGSPVAEASALLAAAARVARACHDAGLVHADLNLGNILVGRARPSSLVVVDLDRAHFRDDGATVGERFWNLSRLARSHEKLFGREGPWGSDPAPRLIGAYAAGDADTAWMMVRMMPAHRRAMRLHRLGWRIAAVFRRRPLDGGVAGPPPRAGG